MVTQVFIYLFRRHSFQNKVKEGKNKSTNKIFVDAKQRKGPFIAVRAVVVTLPQQAICGKMSEKCHQAFINTEQDSKMCIR